MNRIGIMGGTFNPIHLGHVHLAQLAYRQFNLDKVIFIPAGVPPHKRGMSIAKSEDRLNMVRIAIQNHPYFELNDMEIKKNGFSYTYETLEILKEQSPQDEFYLIIGADSLFMFESWYKPDIILKNCILLAGNRYNISDLDFHKQIQHLKSKYKADVKKIDGPMMDISSTAVRKSLKDNILSATDNVNQIYIDSNVIDYILEKKLYENIME